MTTTSSSASPTATEGTVKVLATDKLADLAAALVARGYRVIAPLREGKVVRLALWKPGQKIVLDAFFVNSVKDFLLPRCEVIARYKLEGNNFTPIEVHPDSTPTVVLCVRPCDAASLELLDAVFNWDYEDVYYNARRKACTVVSLVCTHADDSCFCTSVRQSPDSSKGADATFQFADGGKKLLFRAISDNGRAIIDVAAGLMTDDAATPDPVAQVPVRFDLQTVTDWLAKNFDSPLWTELSLGCLGCGACACACPSCHCFDIQDEATRTESVQYRIWDNCGLALFTQHTSGHNPRADRLARRRQRVMHKFSYIPERFNLLGCTGCGRCTRMCPAGQAMIEVCQRIEQICKTKPPRE